MNQQLADGEIAELPVFAKFGSNLYNMESALGTQINVLIAGIIIFAGVWYLTFRRAARQFEKYDM